MQAGPTTRRVFLNFAIDMWFSPERDLSLPCRPSSCGKTGKTKARALALSDSKKTKKKNGTEGERTSGADDETKSEVWEIGEIAD